MKKIPTTINKISHNTMKTAIFLVLLVPFPVFGLSLRGGADGARGNVDATTAQPGSFTNIFQTITNVLLFLLGAIAVIMLVVGGFRYVISGGDSTKVEGAKNTILYAIVGIVVAFLAYAAVDFVFDTLNPPPPPATP